MTAPISGSLPLPVELATLTRGPALGGAAQGGPAQPGLPPRGAELIGGAGVTGVGGASPAGPDFGERVADFLGDVNRLSGRAQGAADGYMRGEHDDVHGTLIAMQEADVALRFATNVRNRVIEAYREVMRMGA